MKNMILAYCTGICFGSIVFVFPSFNSEIRTLQTQVITLQNSINSIQLESTTEKMCLVE